MNQLLICVTSVSLVQTRASVVRVIEGFLTVMHNWLIDFWGSRKNGDITVSISKITFVLYGINGLIDKLIK